jgi:hypothetical protein
MHCELDRVASFGNATLANLLRKTKLRCAANSRPDPPDAPKWKSCFKDLRVAAATKKLEEAACSE